MKEGILLVFCVSINACLEVGIIMQPHMYCLSDCYNFLSVPSDQLEVLNKLTMYIRHLEGYVLLKLSSLCVCVHA